MTNLTSSKTAGSFVLLVLSVSFAASTSKAQETDIEENPTIEEVVEAPESVSVLPTASDEEIAGRLSDILDSTGWFPQNQVSVDNGIVFLDGVANSDEHKNWASELAGNTESVVAVVNRLKIESKSFWDLQPAWREVQQFMRQAFQILPLMVLAAVILILTWLASKWTMQFTRPALNRRFHSRLLADVISRVFVIPVALVGFYLALRVTGLTQIAATVVGGTGLFGLVVGIAFRDIAENFLASVLLSIQRPFAIGDLISVADCQGYVHAVTTRGTTLMSLEGNHIQIPNATIYKSKIENFSANPKTRCDFLVGIDYCDSVSTAQSTIIQTLVEHKAILDDPAPMVLVEELGASTINLRIYFWLDGHEHSLVKVRSSVIRLVKLAIEDAGLTMPDESREVIFPQGVPVQLLEQTEDLDQRRMEPNPVVPTQHSKPETTLHAAEDDFRSEKEELTRQAAESRQPDQGENLLTA